MKDQNKQISSELVSSFISNEEKKQKDSAVKEIVDRYNKKSKKLKIIFSVVIGVLALVLVLLVLLLGDFSNVIKI